jgi:hypothetical protein
MNICWERRKVCVSRDGTGLHEHAQSESRANVIGINQDVIEIVDNTYVEEVRKDVIHEMLESCWCIKKSETHD